MRLISNLAAVCIHIKSRLTSYMSKSVQVDSQGQRFFLNFHFFRIDSNEINTVLIDRAHY